LLVTQQHHTKKRHDEEECHASYTSVYKGYIKARQQSNDSSTPKRSSHSQLQRWTIATKLTALTYHTRAHTDTRVPQHLGFRT